MRPDPRHSIYSPLRACWMSWLLTGSILAVYLAQLWQVRLGFDALGTRLAVRPDALMLHRYGSLLTYAWVHAMPLRSQPFYAGFHLVGNIVPLFLLAPALERRIGPWLLFLLFCGGAVAAALAWIAWRPHPGEAMIGASGALFALITASAVLNVRTWQVDLAFLSLQMRLNMRAGALVLCLFEAALLPLPGLTAVAHIAHLGGALFGVLFTLLFAAKRVEM